MALNLEDLSLSGEMDESIMMEVPKEKTKVYSFEAGNFNLNGLGRQIMEQKKLEGQPISKHANGKLDLKSMVDDPSKLEHVCPHCQMSFVHKFVLIRHIKQIHEKHKLINYQCPKCDYETVRKDQMRSHFAVVHDQIKPYLCSLCDFRAPKSFRVAAHLKKAHEGQGKILFRKSQASAPLKKDDETIEVTEETTAMLETSSTDPSRYTVTSAPALTLRTSDQGDYKTVRKDQLQSHFSVINHQIKSYLCSLCDFRASKYFQVANHLNEAHEGQGKILFRKSEVSAPLKKDDETIETSSTDPSGYTVMPGPDSTLKTSGDQAKSYLCSLCDFRASKYFQVANHLKKAHGGQGMTLFGTSEAKMEAETTEVTAETPVMPETSSTDPSRYKVTSAPAPILKTSDRTPLISRRKPGPFAGPLRNGKVLSIIKDNGDVIKLIVDPSTADRKKHPAAAVAEPSQVQTQRVFIRKHTQMTTFHSSSNGAKKRTLPLGSSSRIHISPICRIERPSPFGFSVRLPEQQIEAKESTTDTSTLHEEIEIVDEIMDESSAFNGAESSSREKALTMGFVSKIHAKTANILNKDSAVSSSRSTAQLHDEIIEITMDTSAILEDTKIADRIPDESSALDDAQKKSLPMVTSSKIPPKTANTQIKIGIVESMADHKQADQIMDEESSALDDAERISVKKSLPTGSTTNIHVKTANKLNEVPIASTSRSAAGLPAEIAESTMDVSAIMEDTKKADQIADESDKKYKCHLGCDFGADDQVSMAEHAMESHHELSEQFRANEVRSFHCPLCSLEVRNSKELFMHIRRTHRQEEDIFICHLCSTLIFSQEDELKDHVMAKHPGHRMRLRCKQCFRGFSTLVILLLHVKKDHGRKIKYRKEIEDKIRESKFK